MGLADVLSRGMKLNLGCGDKILDGYVNVDAASSRAGKQPDLIADISDLGNHFEPSSVDEILTVHVIEHFYYWEVSGLLMSWKNILKSGGTLILETPNLLSACVEILRDPPSALPGRSGQKGMWPLYGDPSWKDPLMCHKWLYTPQTLANVLNEVGFVSIKQKPAQFKLREPRDMRIVCLKP